MSPRLVRAALAVAVVTLVASGCGGGGHRAASPSTGRGGAHPSGTTTTTTPTSAATGYLTGASMEIGFPSAPTNWNPLAAPGPSPVLQAVAAAVLPSAFDIDGQGVPVRSAALLTSAAQTSSSPQTIVYRINARAVWSDGTPVTGADFVATWEAQSGQARFSDLDSAAYTPATTLGYDRIASVTSDPGNPDVVTVVFASPDPDWEALFSPILPAQVLATTSFDHGFTDPVTSLVSAGPFVVSAYQPGSEVLLVRNPKWWGVAANLATIDISLGVGTEEAADSLLAGSLDAAVLTDVPSTVETLATTDGLAAPVSATDTYDDLVFDERRPALAAPALRLALSAALDRRDLAHAAATVFPGATPVDARVRLAAVLGAGRQAPSTPNDATAAPDSTEAGAALAAAGFVYRGTTLYRDRRPVSLTLDVAVDGPLSADEVAAVSTACHEIGVALTVSPTDPATAARQVAAGRYDVGLVAEQVATFPISLTTRYGASGSTNVTGYDDPTMQSLLGRVDALPDGPARAAAVVAVDRLAWSDAVDVPLLAEPVVLAVQSRYSGVTPVIGPAGIAAGLAGWGIPQHA